MSKVEIQNPGVETRLKVKQRGFYHDKYPGFAAVGASHDKAEGQAGEQKLAGALDALEKFGLLQRKDADPVGVLSELFKYKDFGLPVKGDPSKARPSNGLKSRSFGPGASPGGAGSAMEGSSAWRPDGAMAYTGV